MVDPLSYFSFQPVLHDWFNKGRGMCYPVCGMVHIKEPLLLIDKTTQKTNTKTHTKKGSYAKCKHNCTFNIFTEPNPDQYPRVETLRFLIKEDVVVFKIVFKIACDIQNAWKIALYK